MNINCAVLPGETPSDIDADAFNMYPSDLETAPSSPSSDFSRAPRSPYFDFTRDPLQSFAEVPMSTKTELPYQSATGMSAPIDILEMPLATSPSDVFENRERHIPAYREGHGPADITPEQVPGNNKTFLDARWNPMLLDLNVKKFNAWLSDANLSDVEINQLKDARRRKKNRLYTKRSRSKKSTNRNGPGHLVRAARVQAEGEYMSAEARHLRDQLIALLNAVARTGRFTIAELNDFQAIAWGRNQ